MRKFHPKVLDEVSIELDKFDFQTWHSYCFVFDTQHQFPYPGGYTNLTNRAYVDGKLVGSGKLPLYCFALSAKYREVLRLIFSIHFREPLMQHNQEDNGMVEL